MARAEMDVELAVHDALRSKVGTERFDLWFGKQVRFAHQADAFRIVTENDFTLERIKATFHADVQDVVRAICGEQMTIEYAVAPAQAPSLAAKASVPNEEPSPTIRIREHAEPAARPRFADLRSYVVGDENRMAFAAARSAVDRMGEFSPVFLWGPPGTGKTHLLQGIWTEIRRRSSKRVLYLTAEQFTSMFIEALRGSGLPSFRYKCRNVDVLLIDDLQFFANKRATLVELQHTIDALSREGRQMVLAADRSPAELSYLGPELAARMSGGLVCGMQPSGAAARRGILARFAAESQAEVPDSVVEFIAQSLPGDARQLKGALNQVVAMSLALREKVSLALAQSALADVLSSTRRVVQLRDIDRAVCDVFGLDPKTLQSSKRTKVVSQPRMLAMWLARRHTPAVYSEIGEYFGKRSHSTVISAQKTVEEWVGTRSPIRMAGTACQVDEVIRRVEAKLRLA